MTSNEIKKRKREIDVAISKAIHAIRKKLRYNQTEMSVWIGRSQSAISKIEKNKLGSLDASSWLLLCEITGIDPKVALLPEKEMIQKIQSLAAARLLKTASESPEITSEMKLETIAKNSKRLKNLITDFVIFSRSTLSSLEEK
jgi:DNA-binding XRE family transcriptional regulator